VPAPIDRPDVSVDGRTVTFNYEDPWALLSLISANTVREVERRGLMDSTPNVLKVELPLALNSESQAAGGHSFDTARVYMQLSIRPLDQTLPEGTARLVPLPPFPARGPL